MHVYPLECVIACMYEFYSEPGGQVDKMILKGRGGGADLYKALV